MHSGVKAGLQILWRVQISGATNTAVAKTSRYPQVTGLICARASEFEIEDGLISKADITARSMLKGRCDLSNAQSRDAFGPQ